MSIDFLLKDFAYPVSIIKLRLFLEKSQWFSEERLVEFQAGKLKRILKHCYNNIPYYRELFDKLKLKPDDFKGINDLKKLPFLTKEIVRKNFIKLKAGNIKKYKPYLCQTSGTSGEPVRFYLDKNSNILEFCYYWRYWSWAGYKLGARFAEFSLHHFLNNSIDSIADYKPVTNRVILNPARLSFENIGKYIDIFKKYKPRFLKGTPTVLNVLSILLEKSGCLDIDAKAIFTTGEKLLPHQRKIIERVFECKIFDSYAHMERTMAVSQCPFGKYHINSEYGILQTEEVKNISATEENRTGEVIGTSLYNLAMPFLRYKTGDLVTIKNEKERCDCGRGLPLIGEIYGRIQDVIVTPDRRFVANIFIVLNFVEGILWYKIIQETEKDIHLKIIKREDMACDTIEEKIKYYFNKILGSSIRIQIEFLALESISAYSKNRPVESRVKIEELVP